MINKTPKLTLVGAGPGDIELITIKGIKAIKNADVILYDALANEDLLLYADISIPKIFVGKRRGSCAFSQSEINQLIIENALKYGHCVRLKGGDPFIFGRGYEEVEFARAFNIPVDIVPGISSAIAVPEMQQIPLTTRGVSESLWITTGTTKDNTISTDIALAAQSTATVVILMAMSKLAEIMVIFSENGKSNTPVAIIQHGTTKNEKYIIGNVSTITDLAKKENIDNPSIIIVGEVVNLHPDMIQNIENNYEIVKNNYIKNK